MFVFNINKDRKLKLNHIKSNENNQNYIINLFFKKKKIVGEAELLKKMTNFKFLILYTPPTMFYLWKIRNDNVEGKVK